MLGWSYGCEVYGPALSPGTDMVGGELMPQVDPLMATCKDTNLQRLRLHCDIVVTANPDPSVDK